MEGTKYQIYDSNEIETENNDPDKLPVLRETILASFPERMPNDIASMQFTISQQD